MSKKHCWDIIQLNESKESGGIQPYQQNRVYDENGMIPSLLSDMSSGTHAVKTKTRIRRLTEVECERLQGFNDNHTQYGNYDGEVKKNSKTQRYKQCGNAVSVVIVKEIGKQLLKSINEDTKTKVA